MTRKETLNLWTKLCIRKDLTPICLIAYDKDGFPHVYTEHSSKVLDKVFKHLIKDDPIDEKTIIDNQEN